LRVSLTTVLGCSFAPDWGQLHGVRSGLARVPAHPGGEHRRLRLLHRRERALAPVLPPALHRARKPPVWLAGCSTNRTGAWVTQQARNLGLVLADEDTRFLIRDRDSKYGGAFDEVFRSGGIGVVKTPVRAPLANAIAERFVRTVRAECLDWLLIVNRRHPERVPARLRRARQHAKAAPRAQAPPTARCGATADTTIGEIRRRDRLGGLTHKYYRDAA
jgi:hypothetical protein